MQKHGFAAFLGAVLLFAPAPVRAQGLVTPATHWGAPMLPDLTNRRDIGLYFIGFTRYGKEVKPGTTQYTFTPYNDVQETLGFNIITYSETKNTTGYQTDRKEQPLVDPSPLSTRRTWAWGILDDNVPRWLQNEVIHRGRINKNDPLVRVPRHIGDSPDSVGLGTHRVLPLMLELSEEYFLRFYFTRHTEGHDERVPTPYFAGGGYAAGTIDQELFVHLGANVSEAKAWPWLNSSWGGLRSIGLGGMTRAGFLNGGTYLKDVTSAYANIQGVLRGNFHVASFPIQAEFAATASNGFWVRGRTPEQLAANAEIPGSPPSDQYQTKSGLDERFYAIRVRIGDFTFETYNDSFGGKDKGPSFGMHVSYNIYSPPRINSTPPPPETRNMRQQQMRQAQQQVAK